MTRREPDQVGVSNGGKCVWGGEGYDVCMYVCKCVWGGEGYDDEAEVEDDEEEEAGEEVDDEEEGGACESCVSICVCVCLRNACVGAYTCT